MHASSLRAGIAGARGLPACEQQVDVVMPQLLVSAPVARLGELNDPTVVCDVERVAPREVLRYTGDIPDDGGARDDVTNRLQGSR